MGGRTGRWRSVVALATLLAAAAVVVPVVSVGATFAARASVDPLSTVLGDASGVTYVFTVRNTGTTDRVGAVEIVRPAGWTVIGCPKAPPGWTATASAATCRYASAPGPGDDLRPGQASSLFHLKARTAAGSADRRGTWAVRVSRTHVFSGMVAAASMAPGLITTAHSFQVLDAVIADGPAKPGTACPAASRSAIAGSTRTVVICGRNRTTVGLTPSASLSSLTGTMIASPGTFASGPVPPKTHGSWVLGNWNGARMAGAKASGLQLTARIRASSTRTSLNTTLNGYEVTNTAPSADAKTVTGAAEDGSKSITLSGADADGDAVTFAVTSGPSHGTLDDPTPAAICSGGVPNTCTATVLYTPDPDYNGSDAFSYETSDPFTDSAPATVAITVDPVNDAPTATGTSAGTNEDTALPVDLAGLVSDVETSDANLVYTIVTPPAHGGLTGSGGSRSYTPDADYNGADSFTYKVTDRGDPDACGTPGTACDAAETSGTETVSITVDAVNDAPTATAGSDAVNEDGTLPVDLAALASDAETPDSGLTFTVVDAPDHGTLTGSGGSRSYAPGPNFNGGDSLTFKVSDGSAESPTRTFSITVRPVNDAPTAGGTSLTVPEGAAPTAVDLAALAADLETSDANLTYTIVDAPDHGSLTGTGGSRSYAPDGHFNGSDSFTYEVTDRGDPDNCGTPATGCDAPEDSTTETVSITVSPVNDAPVATSDTDTVAEDGSLPVDLAALVSDVETSDANLTYTIVDGPDHGGLTGTGASRTYAPAADYSGSDAFTYKVTDRGDPDACGTPGAGCDAAEESSVETVSLTVTAVNDAPVNTVPSGPVVALTETATPISGLQVSDVDAGGSNVEVALAVQHGTLAVSTTTPGGVGALEVTGNGTDSVTVTSTLAKLNTTFADSDGLVYEGDGGYLGSDELTVETSDLGHTGAGGPLKDTDTVDIQVVPLNQAPTAEDTTASTNEDTTSGPIVLTGRDPDGDSMTFTTTQGSNGSVSAPTTPVCSGTIPRTCTSTVTYTPDPDVTGSDSFTYRANDGSTNSAPATVGVTVNAVNDPPVISGFPPGTLAYAENDPAATIAPAATVTDVDSPNFDTGTLTVDYSAGGTDDDRLEIASQGNAPGQIGVLGNAVSYGGTQIGTFTGGSGTTPLVVTLDADATLAAVQALVRAITYRNASDNPSGNRTARLVVTDGDGAAGAPATRAISLTGVDDPPAAVNDSATVSEDAAATAVAVLGNDTDVDGGPKTISSATDPANGSVVLTGGSPGAHTGVTYEPDPNYCNSPPGTTPDTFTYTLDGGSVATVSMTVTCVDDPPVAVNDSATVLEDAAATSVPVLANDTDVDGGPKTIASATDPANGTVVLTGGSPGAHTGLTYQPDPNACNDPPGTTPDTFTYTVNGGSVATVSMTVTCVNDAPVADDETFTGNDAAHGNTTLQVDAPDDDKSAPATPHTEIAGNILAGDTDVDGPGPLTVTPGTFATNDGGSVAIESDGDFVFEPAATTSCTDTSDFFDYTVEDSGSPEQTDTGRVTIQIAGCVWYVHNNTPGNSGTAQAPFDTLAQAEAASGANHTVFVYDGDNTSTGYDAGGYQMNPGERLIGEHEGLTVDPDGGGALNPDTLRAANAGAHPTLTASNVDVVDLDDGNELRGLNIDPAGAGGGITGGSGDTGGATIDDVSVIDTGTAGQQPALELTTTTGTFNLTGFVVAGKASGVVLANAGAVDFGGDSSQVSLTTDGGPALVATGTNLASSHIDDITVTGSGNGAVDLANTIGAIVLGDGIGTDLALTTASGSEPALDIDNAGSVTVAGPGTDEVHATGGPALDVTATPGAVLEFDDVDSAGSAGDGINLDGLGTGTFTSAAGDIAGAAGTSFDLNGGSGAITYPGTLANGSGTTAIEITGRSGGTVALSGAVNDSNDPGGGLNVANNSGGSTVLSSATKQFNTGATDAVAFTSSDGHTLILSGGGTDIDTTTGNGLNATTSGTLEVGGAGNTIDTTTGRALNVSDTDLGNGDVTLQRVSSNGAQNGIRLSSTGNAGGRLFVTGNGGTCATPDASAPAPATCSGGFITNSPASGISLTNVPGGADLTRVAVTASGDHGIAASDVSGGIKLANSVVQGNGAEVAVVESGLHYTDVRGVTSIVDSDLRNNDDWNARIANTGGTLHLTVTGSDFFNSTVEDGLQLVANGTAAMRSNVTGNRFDDNKGDAYQVASTVQSPSASTDATFTNNTIDGKPATATDGGIVFGPDGSVRGAINNNTITNVSVSAIILNPLGSTGATTFDGTASGNTIGTSGVPDSGSATGDGIQVKSASEGVSKLAVTGNVIRNYDKNGMLLRASESNGGATHLTATGNQISQPDPNNSETAILLQAGSLSSDALTMCADVGGTGALANTFSGSLSPAMIGNFWLSLRFAGSVLRLPGYSGTTMTDRQNYFLGRNSGFGGGPAPYVEDGSQNPQSNAGACQQPASPSLPTAP